MTYTIKENVDKSRLVEWHPSDGWKPVCQALRLPSPEISFPYREELYFNKQRLLDNGDRWEMEIQRTLEYLYKFK